MRVHLAAAVNLAGQWMGGYYLVTTTRPAKSHPYISNKRLGEIMPSISPILGKEIPHEA